LGTAGARRAMEARVPERTAREECGLLDDPNRLSLIIQAFIALGQCSTALVGMAAALGTFLTIRFMKTQNRIAEEAAGWCRLALDLSFSGDVPVDARSISPPDPKTLPPREATRQLYEVLQRWKTKKSAQLPDHKYLVLGVRRDRTTESAIALRNVNIRLRMRIPPKPGKNYVAKREVFNLTLPWPVFEHDALLYLPIEGMLACEAEAKGSYQFAGRINAIEAAQSRFDDYDNAFGSDQVAGGSDAAPA
jgi:hypothetical protein